MPSSWESIIARSPHPALAEPLCAITQAALNALDGQGIFTDCSIFVRRNSWRISFHARGRLWRLDSSMTPESRAKILKTALSWEADAE